MKTFLPCLSLILTFLSFSTFLSAQTPGWAWSRSYGNTGAESVSKIATNSTGDVFAYGTFASATVPVGATTLTNAGAMDIFLIDHDTTGNLKWAISFGGSGDDKTGSMTTDGAGNVVVSGTFTNTFTIGSTTLTSLGGSDIFVAKINNSGTILWVKVIGGTGDDVAGDVKCDAANNIYLTGAYTSPSLSLGSVTVTSGGAYNSFYGKMDGSGNALWAKKISDASSFSFNRIGFTNPGLITFFGTTSNQASMDLGAPSGPLAFGSNIGMPFSLRTDAAGNFVSQAAGSVILRFTNRVAATIAADNDMYFCGSYYGISDPTPRAFVMKTGADNITKTYNAPFIFTNTGTSPYSTASSLVLTKNNRLFSTATTTTGNLNFGNGFSIPPSAGSSFIWETDTALVTKSLLESTFSNTSSSGFYDITEDSVNNSLYTGGTLTQNSPGIGTNFIIGLDTLLLKGSNDILISKISINGYNSGPPLYIEIGNDTLICAGNSVNIGNTAGASGGHSPYTYAWSPSTGLADPTAPYTLATPPASQTYVLKTTDAAAQVYYDTIHISVMAAPIAPTITASGPLTFCNGNTVTLTASAISPGHIYVWSNGAITQSITVSSSGTYSVKDSIPSACISAPSTPVVVTVNPIPAAPTINAGGPLSFCTGGNVVLTSSVGSNYLWSTGATTQSITVATSAIVFVKDSAAGCKSLPSANVTTIEKPLPPVPVISQSGNLLTSSATTGNQWYFNGTNITGATSNQYTYSLPGVYTVTVTDANGCSVISANHTAGFTNGPTTTLRNGETFLHFISLNPLLANSIVNFNLKSAANVGISIFGSNGFKVSELLKTQSLAAGDHRIPIGNNFFKLRAGIYFITYFINGEKVIDKVIVGK